MALHELQEPGYVAVGFVALDEGRVVADKVGSEAMNDGTKGEAVLPRCCEVFDADAVGLDDDLAPAQKSL